MNTTYDPRVAAERQLTLAYEEHAEAEQTARMVVQSAIGAAREQAISEGERHHQACVILLKAIEAEHKP